MYMYIHIGYIRRDEGRTGVSKVCVYVCVCVRERGVQRKREREMHISTCLYIRRQGDGEFRTPPKLLKFK